FASRMHQIRSHCPTWARPPRILALVRRPTKHPGRVIVWRPVAPWIRLLVRCPTTAFSHPRCCWLLLRFVSVNCMLLVLWCRDLWESAVGSLWCFCLIVSVYLLLYLCTALRFFKMRHLS
ncbi:hypothetical protein HOY82DRAFT_551765, partial [Tuber indicum]